MLKSLVFTMALCLSSVANAQEASIPAGTVIAVKTIDKIDSQSSHVGDKFRAALADPISVNGTVVAPVGSDAQIQIVQAKKAGKLTGRAELAVSLTSVTVNGQIIPVTTEDATSASGGKGKSSAVKTGLGAGLGAAIGGIAGGGKGAAIGAGAGAAGGATVAMVTAGPHVTIPSESRLSFTVK